MRCDDTIINRRELNSTLKRIEEALDRRFEKNTDLFISNQQRQDIKDKIKDNAWQSIHDWFYKNIGLSSEVLTMEIIKNSWLIDYRIDNNTLNKYIKPIFNNCSKSIFLDYSKIVLQNKIYSSYEFKSVVLEKYYSFMDVNKSKEILSGLEKPIYNHSIIKQCTRNVLLDCNSELELIENIDKYISQYIILKKDKNFLVCTLREIFEDVKWEKDFFKIILKDKLKQLDNNRENISFWIFIVQEFYYENREEFLDYIVNNFNSYNSDKKFLKRLIKEIIIENINKNNRLELDDLKSIYEQLDEKNTIQVIWTLKSIKDIKIKNDFIKYIRSLDISESQKEALKEVENFEVHDNITTINELIEGIKNAKRSSNIGAHYTFIYYKIEEKQRKRLINELKMYMDNKYIARFYFYLLDKFSSRKMIYKNIAEYLSYSNSEEVYSMVEENLKILTERQKADIPSELKKVIRERNLELYNYIFSKQV